MSTLPSTLSWNIHKIKIDLFLIWISSFTLIDQEYLFIRASFPGYQPILIEIWVPTSTKVKNLVLILKKKFTYFFEFLLGDNIKPLDIINELNLVLIHSLVKVVVLEVEELPPSYHQNWFFWIFYNRRQRLLHFTPIEYWFGVFS